MCFAREIHLRCVKYSLRECGFISFHRKRKLSISQFTQVNYFTSNEVRYFTKNPCIYFVAESQKKDLSIDKSQTTDKPTIFRWVCVVYIRFLIILDRNCLPLFQRIFAIFFIFCTAAVSKHCSETLSFPRIRQ